jgi:putative nucleotidyltransferase with HDIG domain
LRESGCYDGFYQLFAPPASVACDTNLSSDLRIGYLQRTDGTPQLITPSGDISRGTPRFARLRAVAGFLKVSPLVVYVWTLALSAGLFTATVIATGVGLGDVWAVLCLAAVAALAERGSIRVTATTEVSISLVPTLVAAVLFGPLAAIIVAAISMLPDLLARGEESRFLRWAVYTATRVITGGCAGIVALGIGSSPESRIAGLALATAVGALVSEILDIAFNALTVRVRGKSPKDVVSALAPLAFASVPVYAPIVAMVAVAYREVSPLTLPLFLVPALAAQRLHGMYQSQRSLASDLLDANRLLQEANLSFASGLVATLDARDEYTAGHSAAVAIYAQDIAVKMGLSEREQEVARLCGLVHDIGKIGLPPGLLEKTGPLNLEERRLMQEHSAIGERILSNVQGYDEVAEVVRHHHERIDGNGYPDGLGGDSIPLLARIIAVADAYDAMTSQRPYRDAMPSRVARLRLAQAVGTQFDVSVVAAFEAILATATEKYRSGAETRSLEAVPAPRAAAS